MRFKGLRLIVCVGSLRPSIDAVAAALHAGGEGTVVAVTLLPEMRTVLLLLLLLLTDTSPDRTPPLRGQKTGAEVDLDGSIDDRPSQGKGWQP